MTQIAVQIADVTSTLHKQPLTSATNTSSAATFNASLAAIPKIRCSDKETIVDAIDQCPTTTDDSNGVDKKLALGLGLGFGIPYVIVLAIVIYRSRTNAQQNRGFGNQGGAKNEPIQLTPLEKKGDHDELQTGPPGLEPIEDDAGVDSPQKSGLASPSTTSP
jgi:hypothetical protein